MFGTLIFYLILKKHISWRKISIDKRIIKSLLSFGLPLFLVGSMKALFGRLDLILLTLMSNFKSVGIYNVVFSTISATTGLLSVFTIVFLPQISFIIAKGKFDKFKPYLVRIYLYLLILVLPIIIIFLVYAKSILVILFGETFAQGAPALKMLSIIILFQLVVKVNNSVLIGFGETKKLAKYMMIGSLFNIIGNILLIPIFGMLGVAFSTSLSYFGMATYSFISLNRISRIKLEFTNIFKLIFLIFVFFIVLIFIHIIIKNIFFQILFILFMFVIYFYSLIFLRIIKTKEIKRILLIAK